VASPYWSYPDQSRYIVPAALQGRLGPTQAPPADGLEVQCLGVDAPDGHEPSFLLTPGDTIAVEQQAFLDPHKLILFSWQMHQPRYMPQGHTVCRVSSVTFKVTGLVGFLGAGPGDHDGLRGVSITRSACEDQLSPAFRPEDRDQIAKIVGSGDADNDGNFRISGVPTALPDVQGNQVHEVGQVAILENPLLSPLVGDPAVTLKVLGLEWVARAYVDTVLRVELVEKPKHTWQRLNMALHVSKAPLTAVAIRFELSLETTEPR
jgi:hypothetical protein